MSETRILLTGGVGEYEEKKSRFIATLRPVNSPEEAASFIDEMKKKYWDARHNCSACVIGKNNEYSRCSDDGEPSGTAGRPMLEVLTGAEVHNAAVVVTRYFGGVLLGTGGLVRAYSQGSKIALEAGQVVLMQNCLVCSLTCSYNQYGKISSLIPDNGGVIDDSVFETDVKLSFHIKHDGLPALNKKLADLTSGVVQAVSDSEQYFMTEI